MLQRIHSTVEPRDKHRKCFCVKMSVNVIMLHTTTILLSFVSTYIVAFSQSDLQEMEDRTVRRLVNLASHDDITKTSPF